MRVVVALLLLTACGARKDPLKLENQLEREVQALHAVVRDLRYQAETCQEAGSPGAIYSDLHQVFSGTEIQIEREGPVSVVVLPVDLLFVDRNKVEFREEATMTLDLLATALRLHPEDLVEIQGHTDDSSPGRARSHLRLSFRYAEAVAERLIAEFELDPTRFSASGRGTWAPMASNDLEDGQARNRRVEIRIRPGATGQP